MSSLTCPHCGGSEIDTDPARGNSVCTNCGSVLEENIIVSEVQFEETGRGGSAAVGQYVTCDGKGISAIGGFHHGLNKESKMVTLQIGRKLIADLAGTLHLKKTYYVDTAFNFFKMAVTKRFTRGRIRSHVVAACLYIVCRTEEAPPAVMLLDISDIIQMEGVTRAIGKEFGIILRQYPPQPLQLDLNLIISSAAARPVQPEAHNKNSFVHTKLNAVTTTSIAPLVTAIG
uniref:TFIIB-type domain-containing protein n=1 Tax=Strigamia maritima TaxID=126957 RepID=T1IIF0_STRMM